MKNPPEFSNNSNASPVEVFFARNAFVLAAFSSHFSHCSWTKRAVVSILLDSSPFQHPRGKLWVEGFPVCTEAKDRFSVLSSGIGEEEEFVVKEVDADWPAFEEESFLGRERRSFFLPEKCATEKATNAKTEPKNKRSRHSDCQKIEFPLLSFISCKTFRIFQGFF